MSYIIYPSQDREGICLIMPTGDIPVMEVARKDVPADTPYLIINTTDLPQDQTFFNAWEADFSNPDGHGIGAEAWFAEQAEKETQG